MTPWSVEFTSASDSGAVLFPLLDVREGQFPHQAVVIVGDISGQKGKRSHAINLEFTDSGDISGSPESSVVDYWRQDLARVLRLQAVTGPMLTLNSPTDVDNGVVDITLSLTQSQ